MTDRGASALTRLADRLTVGRSSMNWRNGALEIDVDEISSLPLVSRMRGRIVLTPDAVTNVELPLSADGAHVWRPFAPTATIEVDLEAPGWRWSGHGYFDANFGTRRLEKDFTGWTWARFPTDEGALCMYRATLLSGTAIQATVLFGTDGTMEVIPDYASASLPTTRWALARSVGADPGTVPRQVMPMLGGPFYNRAVVTTTLAGRQVTGVHETLDLRRYASRVVKYMVMTRVPRRGGAVSLARA